MKRITAVAALAIVSLALVSPALADSRDDDKRTISEFCSQYNDLGLTHGACVAYFETRNVVPHDASVCQMEWIQNVLGVSNHGQCVKKLADMRK